MLFLSGLCFEVILKSGRLCIELFRLIPVRLLRGRTTELFILLDICCESLKWSYGIEASDWFTDLLLGSRMY